MPNALIRGLLIVLLAAPFAFSQNIYGSFTGVVTDSSGSVVPNALVTARNTGTAAVFTSRSDGEGTFLDSQPSGRGVRHNGRVDRFPEV